MMNASTSPGTSFSNRATAAMTIVIHIPRIINSIESSGVEHTHIGAYTLALDDVDDDDDKEQKPKQTREQKPHAPRTLFGGLEYVENVRGEGYCVNK